MSPVPTETRLAPIGIVLALYPSDPSLSIEIQRAPDSAGSPGTPETIAVVPPGTRTYTDLVSGGTWHYRSRHVRSGATASSWTAWVVATPVPIPTQLPQIPDVGGWLIQQGVLSSGDVSLDAANEQIRLGSATSPTVGTGIFIGLSGGVYEFRAGNPAGDQILWDGTDLTITGAITATTGAIGGWTLSANALTSGSVSINSSTQRILMGSASAPLTGTGVFLGLDGADYEFRVGNPAGAFAHWTGSALQIQGAVIQSPGTGTDIALLGWAHSMVFSATDHDTVAWTSGTLRLQTAGTYAISAGNTGNIAGVTYVYLDTAISTTVLQTTTTQANAVGANRIIVAVCAPVASGRSAEFQVFGGSGAVGLSKLVTATNIAVNTITANEIATNTITANEVASLSFTGKTATFDTGSVGGWTLAAGTLTAGNVTIDATARRILMGSATAPLTGTGVFLGLDGADYEFRVGNPAGEYIHWDGTAFEIKAANFSAANPTFDGAVSIEGSDGGQRIRLDADLGVGGRARLYTNAGAVLGTWSVASSTQINMRSEVNLQLQSGSGYDVSVTGGDLIVYNDIQAGDIIARADSSFDIGASAVRFANIYGDIVSGTALHVGSGAAGSPPSPYARLYWDNAASTLHVMNSAGTSWEITKT